MLLINMVKQDTSESNSGVSIYNKGEINMKIITNKSELNALNGNEPIFIKPGMQQYCATRILYPLWSIECALEQRDLDDFYNNIKSHPYIKILGIKIPLSDKLYIKSITKRIPKKDLEYGYALYKDQGYECYYSKKNQDWYDVVVKETPTHLYLCSSYYILG